MVDEFGSVVRYEDDENEEYTKMIKIKREIRQILEEAKQREKKQKNVKVNKNLDKTKESLLENLINQVEEDADNDNEKNNINNKNNKNFNNKINTDIEVDMDNVSTKEKQQIIKRNKMMTFENKNNNNRLNFHSGIRRTINEPEYLSNLSYSNTFSKSNFNRESKETSTLGNSELKDNPYTYMSFNKTKYKLPMEKDGSIKMFWYDAIEESFNIKPNVILFGKIYEPQSKSFLSISVIIQDIYRTVFILPKPQYENDDQIQKVYEEFEDLMRNRFNNIKEY